MPSFHLVLGYDLRLALLLEDAGVPPLLLPWFGDVGRAVCTLTWDW